MCHIIFLLDDLQENLAPRSRCCRVQEISNGGDRLPVAPDHLPDIRFPHLDFENQLMTLLDFCHQHFFRCFDKLPDDKLEKGLHGLYWAGAAAAFLRAFKIILATVELG
jgi:hypothetical protein